MRFSVSPIVFILFVLCALLSTEVKAQKWTDDPLKKPKIWQDLTENPTDTALWAKYCGKPLSKMTIKQLEEVNMWKQDLMLRQLANQEAVIGFHIPGDQEDLFIDDIAFAEVMTQIKAMKSGKKPSGAGGTTESGKAIKATRAELMGLETIILQEQSELQELKTNIHANFALIEDYYKEIFEQFGMEYTYYKQQYPNGKYPEVRWVEDQEKKLKALKMKQIEELRKKIVVTTN